MRPSYRTSYRAKTGHMTYRSSTSDKWLLRYSHVSFLRWLPSAVAALVFHAIQEYYLRHCCSERLSLNLTRNSADAKIVRHASRCTDANSTSSECDFVHFRITGCYKPSRLRHAEHRLPVMCRFPTFCCTTVCDHNAVIIQTDRRTSCS